MKCRHWKTGDKKHIPNSDRLTLIPSYQCNLACPGCMVGNFVASPQAQDEVSIETLLNFMKSSNSQNINITGGEPFYSTTKDKTYAIVQKAIEMGLNTVIINTNGTIPIPDFNFESKTTLIEFIVSLDGLKEEHDAYRGIGTFDKAVSFMREMIDRGYYVTSHYILKETPNASKIAEYVGFLRKNRLINSPVSIKFLHNMGLATTEGDCFIKQYYEDSTFPKDRFLNFLCSQCLGLGTIVQCKFEGRKNSFTVNPNGDIIPCTYRGEQGPVFGNITSFDLAAVQQNMKSFYDNANCYNINKDFSESHIIIPGNFAHESRDFNTKFYKGVNDSVS